LIEQGANVSSSDDTQLLRTGDFVDPWSGMSVAHAQSGDELVGSTLNNTYVVERLLGEGGMGRVYLARHTRIAQKRVAVKVLQDELAGNAQVLARFQREAEAAAAISHPNVVSVLDIAVTPRGMPYLVCEYLQGIDLAEHLKKEKRLDVSVALSITRQLCRGLGAAHAQGVVHRDLKPPNVFLVGDFTKGAPTRLFAKVLDFGLSLFHTGEGQPSLTKTGFVMGTPSFMAPEQAQGKRVDHRADIYGLGTILYTLLTGRTPFQGDSPHAILLALLNSEAPRPRSLVSSIPPHLELVIERAMARNPADRYPDMAAFEQALEAASTARISPESLQPPALGTPVQSMKRGEQPSASDADIHAARPRLLLSLASALLLLVCAAAVAISGVELATGYTFRTVELRLILLGIIGSSLTPVVVWFFYIRRKIWGNSSRVLALLGQVRGGVVAGLCTYGLLLLAFHLIDDFLLRFLARPDVKPVGATWSGWNLLLPAVALVSAVAVAHRRRLVSTVQPGWRRFCAVWFFTSAAMVIAAGFIYLGIVWRASR
jgi:serine/threonine protein kinase